MTEKDFIRERALTFSIIIVMILRGHKLSLQNTVNKVFESLGKIWEIVSNSAYSQARKKLKAEIFIELNEVAVEGYYEEYNKDQTVKLWRTKRLLGIDGTYINVPDTEETRKEFSIQKNQNKGRERVQAMGSILYDLRNDIGINAELGKIQGEKNFIFTSHIKKCKQGDCIILDRAYADYEVMAMLVSKDIDFCIRFPRRTFAPLRDFWENEETQAVIKLKANKGNKKFVKENFLPEELTVRFIKVELENGEIEVLGTSLLDEQLYPTNEFKQVYAWRWCQETYYNRIKNIFELERFSATSVLSIKQDFFGVIFLATLESILNQPVQQSFDSKSLSCKNPIKTNRSISYISLLDHCVDLLLSPHSSSELLPKLEFLFSSNPSRHPIGRKFDRNKSRNFPAKLFFHKYVKRIIS